MNFFTRLFLYADSKICPHIKKECSAHSAGVCSLCHHLRSFWKYTNKITLSRMGERNSVIGKILGKYLLNDQDNLAEKGVGQGGDESLLRTVDNKCQIRQACQSGAAHFCK